MAAPKPVPFPHITRRADILSGEPIVAGTRISVRTLVVAKQHTPTIEGLLEAYPHLTREQIEEAFMFVADHRAEIDQYIAENEAALISDDW